MNCTVPYFLPWGTLKNLDKDRRDVEEYEDGHEYAKSHVKDTPFVRQEDSAIEHENGQLGA